MPRVVDLHSGGGEGFIQIPGLTAKKLRSHPPNQTETTAGHLDATCQGQQSIKGRTYVRTPAVITASKPAVPTRCICHRVQPVKTAHTGRNQNDDTATFLIPTQSVALYKHI